MVKKKNQFVKLSLRELKHNWFQYLSMLLIVLLAVTLLSGFISNTKMLERRVDNLFEDANIWDINVYTTVLSEEDKTFFNNLSDVTLEYRLYAEGTMNSSRAKIYIGNNTISAPVILSGTEGVLIDSGYAQSYDYHIGDSIVIEFNDYEITYNLEITGFMRYSESPTTKSQCPIYITLSDNPELVPFFQLAQNQILIKTDNVSTLKIEINEHFSDQNNLLFIYTQTSMEAYSLLDMEVSQSETMIYVFPIIFLVVSILVIMTTISQMILRERMNIGTLKALGYSNIVIGFHYSSVGIIVSMAGAILGSILGPQIIPKIMSIKYEIVYNLPSTDIIYSWVYSILIISAFGLLSTLISFLVCHSVLQESPAQCMRPKTPNNKLLIQWIGDDLDEKNQSTT